MSYFLIFFVKTFYFSKRENGKLASGFRAYACFLLYIVSFCFRFFPARKLQALTRAPAFEPAYACSNSLRNFVNITLYLSNNSSSWTEDSFGINVLLEPFPAFRTSLEVNELERTKK
jgi:hypothetical protein